MLFEKGILETEDGFLCQGIDLDEIDFKVLKLLVKAHEKEIYAFGEEMIIARIHRDNDGTYPFSKLDFLSHKLQEMIYPDHVPVLYAASFKSPARTFFVLEKVDLDHLHQAYNIYRQRVHQANGEDYKYDPLFLDVPEDQIEIMAKHHYDKVEAVQQVFANNLKDYGITFDHSQVNIAWRDDQPVALEVHKSQRDYLFDYDRCRKYFLESDLEHPVKSRALQILDRIAQLQDSTPKDTSK